MADKRATFVTPRGIAVYPRLHEPDTKFNPEGVYSLGLRLSAEDAAPLIEKIDALAQATLDKTKNDLIKEGKKPAAAKVKFTPDKCYRPALDDDGEETGDVEFKVKMKASGVSKKTGKPWQRKPALFDAKNHPLPESVSVWGGSEVQVAGEFVPFATSIGVGVSMRLEAVRVIKLVSGGGGDRGAAGYGFGEATEGYEVPEETEEAPFAADEGASAPEDEDF